MGHQSPVGVFEPDPVVRLAGFVDICKQLRIHGRRRRRGQQQDRSRDGGTRDGHRDQEAAKHRRRSVAVTAGFHNGRSTLVRERGEAPALFDEWLTATDRVLPPFQKLARTLAGFRSGILAAIRLRLSNGRVEGVNSKVRLISHRPYGLHSA